jgi:D-glycero-alpha-D-manno-heptose 1-phosphate guanylyltransferase
MISEAIILAGGFGTRLKNLVDEIPKSMAPIDKRPFLTYIFEHLLKYRIKKIVLAAGYKHESIISCFGNSYKGIKLIYSIENEPLGTGGAILKATRKISSQFCYVLNGDTCFNIDLSAFEQSFFKAKAVLSVALKSMSDFDRYGSVTTERDRIISFNEKKFCKAGLINGGVYILDKKWLKNNAPDKIFSFEKEILEKLVSKDVIGCFLSDTYFIDIGIPEDYIKASRELPGLIS